jgi:ubiquinone/menaquinone biosynthesis C-methylase UbiE
VAVESSYLLGHSGAEYRRLMIQAHFMRPWTERFLRAAGLTDGMSVLEAGSGLGDVTLLAAGIVGPAGHVLGVERDAATMEAARGRAVSEGVSDYVDFQVGSVDDFASETRFDALIGRFVLQYQPDPAATLGRLARFVRPGGIIAFHDMDFSNEETSWPPCREWDDSYALLRKLFHANGVPPDFGRRLARVFLDAGLPWPTTDVVVASGGRPGSTLFPWLGSALEAIAPGLEKAGIEPPAGVVLDRTVTATLEKAVVEQGSHVLGSVQYGAWVRVP